MPEIEILPWRQTQVLALQVHPSPSRPHHLIREGPAAGVYVRVGSTNRRADAELIEELRRFSRGEGFDEQPLPALGSEAIDFRAASESFAPFRALRRRDLESLRLVGDHQGKTVPTVGGMFLFGHDRERHFPDAWIQAGRFAGSDKSRILDRIEIHSFPVQAVEEAIAFVQKHSWHGASIGAVRRTDRWSLPPPIFEEIATRFRVTIPTVPVGPTVVDATEQAIIISLKQGPGHAHAADPADRSRAGARDRNQRQGSSEKEFPGRGWSPTNLMLEQMAHLDIDVALVAAGWILQNREAINLAAGPGSYSQHNTVVHKVGCLYCGIPHRNTILMNRADITRAGFRAHQRVTVQEEAGELQNMEMKLFGVQAPFAAVPTKFGGIEPGGLQHHRVPVSRAPTLGFILGGLYHYPLLPPGVAPLVEGDFVVSELLGDFSHVLAVR
jgi:hypothetical protein